MNISQDLTLSGTVLSREWVTKYLAVILSEDFTYSYRVKKD